MPTVTFATHCHSRDLPRLYAPDHTVEPEMTVLEELIGTHNYPFAEIQIVHQRCGDLPFNPLPGSKVIRIEEKDYPYILGRFGIPHRDPVLSELTHGWTGPHYYEHHCVNHCAHLLNASSDYILFSDADCRMIAQPEGQSWVTKAIEILRQYPEVLIVAPSDGGHEFNRMLPDGVRLTQTVSQQIFLAERRALLEMDFTHLPWDGQFRAPYGPFQEFYGLFEGHLWRWMDQHGLYRAVLPESFRYWHGQWH